MAFGKNQGVEEPRKPEKVDTSQGKLNSLMGQGSKVSGSLVIQGSIRIDGEFEGKLEATDTLVVGKTGKLIAEVKVKRAVIGGAVQGRIEATQRVELQSGSALHGDMVAPSVIIDEGVFFEGRCEMPNAEHRPSWSDGEEGAAKVDRIRGNAASERPAQAPSGDGRGTEKRPAEPAKR
jgi:cytoskeletal protein CcmA (bactofilin family)